MQVAILPKIYPNKLYREDRLLNVAKNRTLSRPVFLFPAFYFGFR